MIRAERLTKTYGPLRAVDSVSFEIGRGEIVGFLGRNGAGKSTTMRMLCGVLEPDDGQAWIDGLPVGGDDPRPRARVGYLPEGTPLQRGMRVIDYLRFVGAAKGLGGGALRGAVRDVVQRCGLDGYASRKIEGLSKGYRQRVGLAQALLADAPVLVLDEPSSGLDPAEVVRIRELVRELGRTRTVLLSTHVLREVEELCSRVLILAGGKLVADGKPRELASTLGARLLVRARCGAELLAELARAAGATRVEAASAQLAAVRLDATAVYASVTDASAVAERLARALAERSIALLELAHATPSLEDVFLERTSATSTSTGASSALAPSAATATTAAPSTPSSATSMRARDPEARA